MATRRGSSKSGDTTTGGSSPFAEKRAPKKRLGIGFRLRSYFLTGLIIVGPITITVLIVWWFIGLIDAYVKPLVPDVYNPETYLPFALPGVGLLFALASLTVIGALAANLLGRSVVSFGEMILGRMPVVRNVYSGLKQIFETVLSESSQSFKRAGLIEYPRRGLYSVVFISTDAKGEVAAKWEGDTKLISVFLPTTPNPTSGYLLFVPQEDIVELEMSVEEAAKLVISAGLVTPDYVTPNATHVSELPGTPGSSLEEARRAAQAARERTAEAAQPVEPELPQVHRAAE